MVTGLVLYAQHHVARYPSITLDPAPLPSGLVLAHGLEIQAQGAYLKTSMKTRFRAYQPDVHLRIRSDESFDKKVLS